MATIRPDDLKEGGLRLLAIELGIPADASRKSLEILQDVQQKFPNLLLLSIPLTPNTAPPRTNRDWFGWIAILSTTLTAIVTVVIAFSNWKSAEAAYATINQSTVDRENDKKTAWQTAKVYQIIDEGGKDSAGNDIKDYKGLDFKEINTRYRSAAQDPEMPVKLGLDDIKDFQLQKILFSLQESQLIYRTFDGKYVAQRVTVNSREDLLRSQVSAVLANEIVKILRRDSGKHTEDDLMALVENRIRDRKMPWDEDDYRITIFNMTVGGTIIVDDKDRIWLATRMPKDGPQKRGGDK